MKTALAAALLSFALVAASAPFAALAQEQPRGFSVGIGVAGGSNIYIGEDSSATALPILRYDTDAVSIGLSDGVRVTVFDRTDFRLSAIVSPRFSEIDASDAPELDGLDREVTADGGVQASYRLGDRTRLRFRAVTELTDERGGSEISLGINQAIPLGGFPLMVGGGVTWQSSDLSSYLYGISASEATGTRSAYNPGDVLIRHISIDTMVPVSDKTRLIANVRADFLPDEVSDSPIVDEDVAVRGFLGISYNF